MATFVLLKGGGLTAFGNDHTIVRRHIIDLAVLAATARTSVGESSSSAVAAVHLTAASSTTSLRTFRIQSSACSRWRDAMRISPRYLQRLLQSAGTSFTAHVTELRLKQAFMLLTAQSEGKVRISDIALQSGFSDVSYFNRLFRSRFGGTPSDVRAQATERAIHS